MPITAEVSHVLLANLKQLKINAVEKSWANYMETVSTAKAILVEVDNAAQVRQTILAVKALDNGASKISIRAAAGGETKPDSLYACFFPWASKQRVQYNQSFSFSQGAVADVIIRFSDKFQQMRVLERLEPDIAVDPTDPNPIKKLPETAVEVTAGVQIATLADFLEKNKLSLRTVSMIPWVTPIGLAGTGGHGTGRDEPSFSGQILSMTVCDMNGEIQDITPIHPDFQTLCSAHAGMLGIVLKIKLKAVQAFKLEETIRNYNHVSKLAKDLPELLQNQYFTLMHVPTYSPLEETVIDSWLVRLWNYTERAPTLRSKPTYAADTGSLVQELGTKTGDNLQYFLTQDGLQDLIPAFMVLTAAIVTRTRGKATVVGVENHITHYQVAFPKAMRDVSYMIPVKDKDAPELLGEIMTQCDMLLRSAGKRKEHPITYAIYVRYLKGCNGGLSSTATSSPDEHILAIDMVTHPYAKGIAQFEEKFLNFLHDKGITPRHHLGKNFPHGVTSYRDFLSAEALATYKEALLYWYGSEGNLKQSPFITPYLNEMILTEPDPAIVLARNPIKIAAAPQVAPHSAEECQAFLQRLMDAITTLDLPISTEIQKAKQDFIHLCGQKIEHLDDRFPTLTEEKQPRTSLV